MFGSFIVNNSDAVYYLGTPFFQAGHKQNYHRSAQNVPNEWLGSSLMSLQRQQPGRNKDRFMRSLRNFQHSLKAPRVQCSHAAKTIWPVKRTLSSSSFNKHKISSKAEMPLRRISVLESVIFSCALLIEILDEFIYWVEPWLLSHVNVASFIKYT